MHDVYTCGDVWYKCVTYVYDLSAICMCMICVCDVCTCIHSYLVDRGGQVLCFITLCLISLVQDLSLNLELVIVWLAEQ